MCQNYQPKKEFIGTKFGKGFFRITGGTRKALIEVKLLFLDAAIVQNASVAGLLM
jgi:hypothetical protein